MAQHTLKTLPKNTFELEITIPWEEIQKAFDDAFELLRQDVEAEGFRKGKVPPEIAMKHMKREAVYDRMIRDLLPTLYEDAIKKEKRQPIIAPRVELKSAKDKEPWTVLFTFAERPEVTLGAYQEEVKKIRDAKKAADIWVPGKDEQPKEDSEQEKSRKQQELLNEILGALLASALIEVPDMIVEDEVNNRLSRVVDDVQRLGMTLDTYLKSKNLTEEQMKAQLRKEIEETHKLEFILNQIAEDQNITVEQEELDKLFASVTNEKERQEAQKNAYFYAVILRKQKVFDYLLGL